MQADPWLDRWLPLVRERAGKQPVLELGCGAGIDTAQLTAAGVRVVALDILPDAIAEARARVPSAELHRQDMRAPFPLSRVPVVVASLCLHYFSWADTLALGRRIHQVLAPDGVLLCRLNSTNDHHHGASGHPPIEADYYLVDGKPKRFFRKEAVQALFAQGWRTLHLEEKEIHRFAEPKAVWEVILEKT